MNTKSGLAVHCFDDLKDSDKETERIDSPSSDGSTTKSITTSTATNHHSWSKFPPQVSEINDDTLDYVKITDLSLQQHQAEDDEDGYSSMSLYNT